MLLVLNFSNIFLFCTVADFYLYLFVFNKRLLFRYSHFLEDYYLEHLKKKMRAKFKTLSPSKNSSKILEASRNSIKPKAKVTVLVM
jgi:hypothetical protein